MTGTNRASLRSALGALGVVYGDIGTSVLYAFRECLSFGVSQHSEGILGILSLIIWTLILLGTVKYLTFVTRADNHGEGGILALLSLAFPESISEAAKPKLAAVMIVIGVAGAALLYGDGVITPAISVLSATEGLIVAAPWLEHFTVPLTILILVGLFSLQRKGTESVAKLFGPIMLVWFLVLAITGVREVVSSPEVLAAINPFYAIRFLATHGWDTLIILGGVFLVTTGAEALYADLGHFGRKPIALAWYLVVFPALILNYLGQGALALRDPTARENPFFHMVPEWLLWPLIALATVAAVIASQALIFGSIFPDNAVRPHGLYALYQHPAYLARRAWANLHPANQYSAGSRLHRARPHISQQRCARQRLRHRGHLNNDRNNPPAVLRRSTGLEVERSRADCALRSRSSVSNSRSSRRIAPKSRRGLVAFGDRRIVFLMMTTWKKGGTCFVRAFRKPFP